jgi:hypothetical protein
MKARKFPQLERLLVRALSDESFCQRLLNGDRHRVLDEFDLTRAERDAVLAVKAETINHFAQGLLVWIRQQAHTPRPDPGSSIAVGDPALCTKKSAGSE